MFLRKQKIKITVLPPIIIISGVAGFVEFSGWAAGGEAASVGRSVHGMIGKSENRKTLAYQKRQLNSEKNV
jgi:hypothetical protein